MKASPNICFYPQLPPMPEAEHPSRVLIVENEERVRAHCRDLLAAEGRSVETCGSSDEALQRLRRRDVDLLILGLDLPQVPGMEIVEWMAENDIPTAVVLLDRKPSPDALLEATPCPAFARVAGEQPGETLVTTIEGALRRRQLAQARARLALWREHSERLYRFLVEQSPDIIYTVDRHGCFLYLNDRVQFLLGHTREELIGQHYSVIVHPDDREHARFAFNERRIGRRASTNVEIRLQTKPEALRSFENRTIVTVLSAQGLYAAEEGPETASFMGTSGVVRDISERKKAEEAISFQAFHDLLTGLPNRVLFEDRLTVAITQAKRKKRQLGVMYMDIDRFKYINDTYGHHEGDELLKCFAKRVRGCLRSGDTLGRQGGDEFTILLPDLSGSDDAAGIAGKILGALRQPFPIAGRSYYASASVGIALYPEHGETAEVLLRNADTAMYQIKGKGKNGVLCYAPEMQHGRSMRATMQDDMRAALEHGEQFEVYYQPLISLRRGLTIGVEAFLRWRHPRHGLLVPSTFLPLAEESGMVLELADWMLTQAIRQFAEWRAYRGAGLRLSLNISSKEVEGSDLAERLLQRLAAHAVPADTVDVEISENVLMNDHGRPMETLKRLRNEGVRVSIDDFGTRYSPLNYLRRFPVTGVKIDRAFVRELDPDVRGSASAIEALAAIARSFGLRVQAEGVETAAQRQLLTDLACDEMQGFLFSKPLPASEFESFLSTGEFPQPQANGAAH